MISVENVSVQFDDKVVLQNISLQVQKSQTVVIMGKNGEGKSVLLKAIAGLLDGYDGTISLQNNSIDNTASGSVMLGYVFQKGGLFDSMNVYDNIAFPLQRMKLAKDVIDERVFGALKRVGLEGSDQKAPSELSGGMQKRVGIARAICFQPSILLYDDPTAGLDPILSDSIADLILEIKQSLDATSIAVTHDLAVAKKIADYIGLLYNGDLIFYGTNTEFFSLKNEYARQFVNGELEGPIDIY